MSSPLAGHCSKETEAAEACSSLDENGVSFITVAIHCACVDTCVLEGGAPDASPPPWKSTCAVAGLLAQMDTPTRRVMIEAVQLNRAVQDIKVTAGATSSWSLLVKLFSVMDEGLTVGSSGALSSS